MLPSKTVFIVGAGASSEVGLPVGSQLKALIGDKLDLRFQAGYRQVGQGDIAILDVLRQGAPTKLNDYLAAGWRIRDGLPLSSSIDDFIDAHRDDQLVAQCGKVAIAVSILEAERQSQLFYERTRIDSTIQFRSIQNTWYMGFYQLLTQQVSTAQLKSLFENVTVVTFNYDRCVEHFLTHAIAANYHLPLEETSKLVESLALLRPYGAIGKHFGHDALAFGAKQLPPFDVIVKSLRTYTEQIEDKASLKKIQSAIGKAEVLVFLGNAFHPNNMKLLRGDNPLAAEKRIYATRMGISDSDLKVVRKQFANLCGIAQTKPFTETFFFTAENEKCSDLFARYRMSLRQ